MAEWLYEEGIGEARAILVEDGIIVEAAIELPDALRAGTVADGRLTSILLPGRRGIVRIGDSEALIEPLPGGPTEGQTLRIEITREAIPEEGRPKLARCRASDSEPRTGPSLAERIGSFERQGGTGADLFEQAGWSELLEEATNGQMDFPGGSLRMSLTPAMTLFDVDGALPAAELAEAGAEAAGRAIRRMGIAGSIGIDLPTFTGKAERQRAAAALDSVLPQPFERTAVNGFGFLQIVRRRERPSLPELLRSDPIGAAARALLRKAERARGTGERELTAAPAVVARIEANPQWIAELERRTGAPATLRADKGLAISAGHAQTRFA